MLASPVLPEACLEGVRQPRPVRLGLPTRRPWPARMPRGRRRRHPARRAAGRPPSGPASPAPAQAARAAARCAGAPRNGCDAGSRRAVRCPRSPLSAVGVILTATDTALYTVPGSGRAHRRRIPDPGGRCRLVVRIPPGLITTRHRSDDAGDSGQTSASPLDTVQGTRQEFGARCAGKSGRRPGGSTPSSPPTPKAIAVPAAPRHSASSPSPLCGLLPRPERTAVAVAPRTETVGGRSSASRHRRAPGWQAFLIRPSHGRRPHSRRVAPMKRIGGSRPRSEPDLAGRISPHGPFPQPRNEQPMPERRIEKAPAAVGAPLALAGLAMQVLPGRGSSVLVLGLALLITGVVMSAAAARS